MKTAVCSSGEGLDAGVDPRFGRCRYFVVVDSDKDQPESLSNEAAMSAQGAGIQAAQMLASQGVGMVVGGNFGPNAFQALSAAGIRAFICPGGTVRETLALLASNQLEEVSNPTVSAHAGLGFGQGQAGPQNPSPGTGGGMGSGGGLGRGGGMGRGRGMGRGGGRGRGSA